MSLLDWLIVLLPLTFVIWMGFHTRRFVRGVADFLAAGRLCGRYVMIVGDIANALSIIGIVAFVEVHYRTGFALSFWNRLLLPLGIVMGLTGYCTYRFRETRSLSIGQFLEVRYSRGLRIFAAALRTLSEILANMIMPAVAARFFIYYLGLPHHLRCGAFQVPTFMLVVVVCLFLAILLICLGGTLALVVTDALQGMICYPLMAIFVIFMLTRFSWSGEIVPVMLDRASGESFLNPYDIAKLRDFNLFSLVVALAGTILHRASWIGAGVSAAARSAHEQKMAAILGTWRGAMNAVLYVLVSVTILTLLSHMHFADSARRVRREIVARVAGEVVEEPSARQRVIDAVAALPREPHVIGRDEPLSEERNLDTPYLESVHQALLAAETAKGKGHAKFQEFKTLYHQMSLAVTMRSMLPVGLTGLFCLLMVMAMISTDDSRIFSSALTIMQDVILPLLKRTLTPGQHIRALRLASIGVGVLFLLGSSFMAQLDYINLYSTLVCSMWLGGCGPVMIFGLYSRFGTTAGAWTSILSGMVVSFGGIMVQRNWAGAVYPWLERRGLVEGLGLFLERVSAPFTPYIVWKMDPVRFPINSYEIYFLTMVLTITLYIVVSRLTCREPFNLERMLHRGKYSVDGSTPARTPWRLRTLFSKLIGITPEYTRGDKVIAWGVFFYSFGYSFLAAFVGVAIWNAVSPWPNGWWSRYFLAVELVVPGIVAAVMTFWFGIGGVRDMRRLFRDLRQRDVNPLDNGRVEGHISLVDRERISKVEQASPGQKQTAGNEDDKE